MHVITSWRRCCHFPGSDHREGTRHFSRLMFNPQQFVQCVYRWTALNFALLQILTVLNLVRGNSQLWNKIYAKTKWECRVFKAREVENFVLIFENSRVAISRAGPFSPLCTKYATGLRHEDVCFMSSVRYFGHTKTPRWKHSGFKKCFEIQPFRIIFQYLSMIKKGSRERFLPHYSSMPAYRQFWKYREYSCGG